MKTEQDDNFEEALSRLYDLTNFLYGGYYEPKSDRDKELADALHEIWVKFRHSKETLAVFEFISDPKNKHLFTKEVVAKMFAHIK